MFDLAELANVVVQRGDVRDSPDALAALFAIAEAIQLFKQAHKKPKGNPRRR